MSNGYGTKVTYLVTKAKFHALPTTSRECPISPGDAIAIAQTSNEINGSSLADVSNQKC